MSQAPEMIKTFSIGKILDKDAKIIISSFGLTLDRTSGSNVDVCSFDRTGMMTGLHHHGDIYPIGDEDEVITDPKLHIQVYDDTKKIMYQLKGKQGHYMMGSNEVLKHILAQHDLAENFYEKLTNTKLPPEQEAGKNILEEMLKNTIHYDKALYQQFKIEEYK